MPKEMIVDDEITLDYSSLQDALDWAHKKMKGHPEAKYEDFKFESFTTYDISYCHLTFERLETDEEEKLRMRKEAEYKADREAYERNQYEALKKKFEGSK